MKTTVESRRGRLLGSRVLRALAHGASRQALIPAVVVWVAFGAGVDCLAQPAARETLGKEDGATRRTGAVFGVSLGAHYTNEFGASGFDTTIRKVGPSLGLQAGVHVGQRATLLADLTVSGYATTAYRGSSLGVIVGAGPTLRFQVSPQLSLEGGAGLMIAGIDWDTDDDTETWRGPGGHVGAAVELMKTRSGVALEARGRLDYMYLYPGDCESDDCYWPALGRATMQLALAWN